MMNEQNFNQFITELNKRLKLRDSSCTISTYNNPQGAIVVRIDYDYGRDQYVMENTMFGVQWYCLY